MGAVPLDSLRSTMKRLALIFVSIAWAVVLGAPSAKAVVFGQLDDFENGTTMGWANGVPGYVVNMSSGGPGGAADNFLQLTADGIGQGGRLTTFNLQQWLGNYVAQGVSAIELDLRNQGSTQLSIRLAFKSANTADAPGYLSQAIVLAPGSGWQHFSISLTAANMIRVGNAAAHATFFSTGIADARIINAPGTTNLNGDFVTGQLGIDNIHAIPEPATAVCVGGGLLLLGARWLRSRGAVTQDNRRGS